MILTGQRRNAGQSAASGSAPPILLTALVVAHNESDNLGPCLERLAFADEILVVLDRTTDSSEAIARAHGARVASGAWPIQGDRRNFGLALCRGAWILEVDADERVTPELAAEISATIRTSASDYHAIPVDNYVGERLVRHGWGAAFGKGSYVGLFRNGHKTWHRDRVHPKVTMRGIRGAPLQARLTHYVDRDLGDMLERLNRYSNSRALDLVESGDIGTLRRNLLRILGRFYKCFVLRKGYKEGGLGFLIAVCAGLYPILSYLKAREMLGWSEQSAPDSAPARDTVSDLSFER